MAVIAYIGLKRLMFLASTIRVENLDTFSTNFSEEKTEMSSVSTTNKQSHLSYNS